MKKTLLLLSFSAFAVSGATAQITITSADITTPGHMILQAHDTLPTVVTGGAGISMTWNMSGLNTHTIDTLNFIPYAWAPNPSFSTANIVVKQGTDEIYSYIANTPGQLSQLGINGEVEFSGTPVTLKQINIPVEKLAVYPFTYNSAFTNDFVTYTPAFDIGSASPPIDSVRMRSRVHKTVLVDAWGSLTTPLGTYNVVRAKETRVKHDTTDIHVTLLGGWQNSVATSADSTTQYSWWANGVGFPLVTLIKDSLGNVVEANWLKTAPTVGINEYTAPVTLNVYPNPAQTEVNVLLDATAAKAVQIYDVMGRLVETSAVTADLTTIGTSAFANGAYTFSVIAKDNSVLSRGKFTVAK